MLEEKFKSNSNLSSTTNITVKAGSKTKAINKNMQVQFSGFCLAIALMENPINGKIEKKVRLQSSKGVTGKNIDRLNKLNVLVPKKILHNYPIVFAGQVLKQVFR